MNDVSIKDINARLNRIESVLKLADFEQSERVAETPLSVSTDVFERWERDGIKSKLANIIVAPENVTKKLVGGIGTEKEGKMYFTWDEAMELEEKVLKPNGWRLPTRSEFSLLAEEFGQDADGKLAANVIMKNLHLGLTGFFWGGALYGGTDDGFYWSSVLRTDANAYGLYFNISGKLDPQDHNNKMNGLAIRAIKEIK